MATRDARVGTGGMWLIGADGKPIDNFGGGGGGGTPLPPELVEALQDALAGYQAAIEGRQAHSANLDELSGVDPSDVGKALLTAADPAAARAAIGATAPRIIGERVELPVNTPAAETAKLLPEANTVFNIADHPVLAQRVAAVNAPATAFVRSYNAGTTTSGGMAVAWFPAVNLWVMSMMSGADAPYPFIYTSPDLVNWTKRQTLNYNTAVGGVGTAAGNGYPGNVIDFALIGTRMFALVSSIAGGSTQNTIYSSDDGIVWTVRAVTANLNVGAALAGTATFYRLKVLNGELWMCGTATKSIGGTNTTTVAYVIRSPDGINWTDCGSAFQNTGTQMYAMDYLDGTYLVAGINGLAMTSGDKATWTPRNTGITESIRTAINDGARFILTAISGRLLTVTVAGLAGAWTRGIVRHGIGTPIKMIRALGVYVLISTSSVIDNALRVLVSPNLVDWRDERPDGTEVSVTPSDIAVGGPQGNRFALAISFVSAGGINAGLFATAQVDLNPDTQRFIPARDAGLGMRSYLVAEE